MGFCPKCGDPERHSEICYDCSRTPEQKEESRKANRKQEIKNTKEQIKYLTKLLKKLEKEK